jgi:hypothetical protein
MSMMPEPSRQPGDAGKESSRPRGRWTYGLWAALLLSIAALVLWEWPLRVDQASLVVQVRSSGAPPGTRVQIWNGPRARWEGLGWSGAGAPEAELRPEGYVSLPLLKVRIARRRWMHDYIPRGTSDLVMLKFTAPDGPPRYYTLPIAEDIRKGVLRPRWRLTISISMGWAGLATDGKASERMD